MWLDVFPGSLGMTQGLTGIRSLWHDPWMEVDASLGLSWIYKIYMKRTYSLELFHMGPQLLANSYTKHYVASHIYVIWVTIFLIALYGITSYTEPCCEGLDKYLTGIAYARIRTTTYHGVALKSSYQLTDSVVSYNLIHPGRLKFR